MNKHQIVDLFDKEIPNIQVVAVYLQYLKTLQEGRVKPDLRGNNGTIRDSIDNVPEIKAVKEKLNFLFNLDIEKIEALRNEQESRKPKDYR